MPVLLTLLGVALTALALRDIFHTLFHPSGSGALSSQGVRYVWRAFRVLAQHRPAVLSLAGPLALLLIIVLWTLSLALGWALLLWPYLPEHFLLATGLEPDQNAGFLDSVYLSLVTLATLGYGEITPQTTWLRMLAPLEALIGFALMTASISWILSIYPVLARRRNLAREVALWQRAAQGSDATAAESDAAALADLCRGLTVQLIAVRNDYYQFPITYYFQQPDRDSALDSALPHLASLAQQVSQHPSASVRLQAVLLREAVRDLAASLAATFLNCGDAGLEQVLIAYAADHLRPTEPTVHEAGDVLDQTP